MNGKIREHIMNRTYPLARLFLVAAVAAAASGTALADRPFAPHWHDGEEVSRHDYHRHGDVVPRLPPGYRVVPHRDGAYYFYGGTWYRPQGPRFIVVAPPIGLFVPFLPPFYTTVWIGGTRYYYADDVYYRYDPYRRGYIVVEQPARRDEVEDGPVLSGPAASEELFIYPKEGQSTERQASDRYECHRWASDQTGFDPTEPSGGVAPDDATRKRADYRRAMTACLEARGYSVK